jgi:SAM-dependent methyltransferase
MAVMSGSAERWGPLWGARADDWARSEEQQTPVYEEAIRRVGLRAGQRVLDVGCGAGVFLELAAARGAVPAGIDASEALIEHARRRVPEADLRVGDMEALPFANDGFDVVTGLTSYFFATDMVDALRESGRVATQGARVFIQVWGPPERNDLEAMKQIARPFMPPRPPDAPEPPPLWKPGVLEEIAARAGLVPEEAFDFGFAYEYEDEEMLGRLLLAPMGLGSVVGLEREQAVRAQIVEVMSPFRTSTGGYRLDNLFRCLVARAA